MMMVVEHLNNHGSNTKDFWTLFDYNNTSQKKQKHAQVAIAVFFMVLEGCLGR